MTERRLKVEDAGNWSRDVVSLLVDSRQVVLSFGQARLFLKCLVIEGDDSHDVVGIVGNTGRQLADSSQPLLCL